MLAQYLIVAVLVALVSAYILRRPGEPGPPETRAGLRGRLRLLQQEQAGSEQRQPGR